MESHPFISDLAMVFDVAVELEDTGFNGARSSTWDEGASQHICEAEAEITSSEVDHVLVKLRSRCCVLFDGEWQKTSRASEMEEEPHRNLCGRRHTEAGGSRQEGGSSRAVQVDRHVAR